MSILIKTMTKLPDHCYECPCHDGESGYCQADEQHRYSDYRPFWCPLIETREESKELLREPQKEGDKNMTVGYLKEQLENYPDDARIILDCGPINLVLNDKSVLKDVEIIDMFSIPDHDKIIFMQTRNDFDYMNEVKEKKAHMIAKGIKNWKEILLNQGFTEDEIKEEKEWMN